MKVTGRGFGEWGVYQLLIRLRKPCTLAIAKFAGVTFSEGYYVYTGRALAGYRGRLKRHVCGGRKAFWHIDYLLRRARLVGAKLFAGRSDECAVAEVVRKRLGGRVVAAGFGASDCRCRGHLALIAKVAEALRVFEPIDEVWGRLAGTAIGCRTVRK